MITNCKNSVLFPVKTLFRLLFVVVFLYGWVPAPSQAYPIFAQQNYSNPREPNGRIVCANCHLAQKPIDVELPQSVLPDTVFEAIVKIPYDSSIQQVVGNGKKGALNVGAVMILPEGFKVAPSNRISPELKKRINRLSFQSYSPDQSNILVVGPVPGKKYTEMVFPILSPDPSKNKNVSFLKYPIYVGGNRGRGQVYPDGSKSNNTVYTSSVTGTIQSIEPLDQKGGWVITTLSNKGETTTDRIPAGPDLLVQTGQQIEQDQPLTNNPNVGGFGQQESEVVLQNPLRIQGLLAFFVCVILTQIFLVLKKKQFEKVQLFEMNF